MTTHDLLHHVGLFEKLHVFRLKKDIPPNQSQFSSVLLVNFGLYGRWYVLKGFHGLKLKDGSEMPVHIMHPLSGNPVIGNHDLEAAKGTKHETAWRESYAGKIGKRIGIQS